MGCTAQKLELFAGEIFALPVTFKDDAGAVIDLTGATVHFIAKVALSDEDEVAVIGVSQDTHADAEAGETTIEIDLSGVDEEIYAQGVKLTGALILEDAAGQRMSYGNFPVSVEPSPKREFA